MRKILIVILIIMSGYLYGNNYEILEENGELFFKYSKEELLKEVQEVLDENKEILSRDFKIDGEKKYIEEIRFDKNYIDISRYNVCKIEIEIEIEKCLFYMNEKRVYYKDKKLSEEKFLKNLHYEDSGKEVRSLFIDEGPLMWFEKNKLKKYRLDVRNEEKEYISSVTYIFDKKENLDKIEVSNPIGIKSTLYGEEVKGYTSSVGSENYYFDSDGKFIKKEMYYKYGTRKK